MANTHSPTLTLSESPTLTDFKLSASICKRAKSVPSSKPIISASNILLSINSIMISSTGFPLSNTT